MFLQEARILVRTSFLSSSDNSGYRGHWEIDNSNFIAHNLTP